MQKRDKMFSNTHLLAIKNDVPVDTSLMICKDQQCNEKKPRYNYIAEYFQRPDI